MGSTEQSVAGGDANLAQAEIESQNCAWACLAQACPASAEIRFMSMPSWQQRCIVFVPPAWQK